jgi:glutathione S-transferase
VTENQAPQTPNFISLDDAAAMTEGTRITFIPGLQALYAEALKNICYAKGIPVIRALHPQMGVDKVTGEDRQARLYELTSQTGLPTMFYNKERPRNVWTEQLALAESIGSAGSPTLIPENYKHRVDMFGLCAITLAEDGLVWNMRILNDGALSRKYGYNEHASAAAPEKIVEIISVIDACLDQQAQRGSQYLVGDAVSAADIYWATMSMCITATPPEVMPVTQQNQGMLKFFASNSKRPEVAKVLSPRILDHQRYILTTYCETPAVLGGDLL